MNNGSNQQFSLFGKAKSEQNNNNNNKKPLNGALALKKGSNSDDGVTYKVIFRNWKLNREKGEILQVFAKGIMGAKNAACIAKTNRRSDVALLSFDSLARARTFMFVATKLVEGTYNEALVFSNKNENDKAGFLLSVSMRSALDVCEMLMCGFDPSGVLDEDGCSALVIAADNNDLYIASTLLEYYSPTEKELNTALFCAEQQNNDKMVGAINQKSAEGVSMSVPYNG